MTHVSGDTHAGVASSPAKKQAEKIDNPSENLFENLFSIVSELDPDSVNFLSDELSKKQIIDTEARTQTVNIEQFNYENTNIDSSSMIEERDVLKTNLASAMEKIRSILNNENIQQQMNGSNSSTQDISTKLKNLFNYNGDFTENTKGIRANSLLTNNSFYGQPLTYPNSNLNFLGINNSPNASKSNEKLFEVVKLIEQALVSKDTSHPQPQTIAQIKSAKSSKINANSAFDEAIEFQNELKISKKANVGLESLSNPRKELALNVSKDGVGNKNNLTAHEFKQTILNQAELSSLNNQNNLKEVKIGTTTRQVELGQQIANNSTNQPSAQIGGLDMNSGDGTGQDSNENHQLTQQHRNSSALSTIYKLNMADKAWKEALVRQVEKQLKEGGKTLDITLNPKQLGRMTVSINLTGDDASIQISTETSGAASILLESESKLAQMMQEIGLRLNLLQASLSDKHKKGTKEDENIDKRTQKASTTSEERSRLDERNLKNIDNSILNIFA